ncbi:MAG: ABC transporter permease [Firmicutes bacterium]|nr:ABC transporter permease [Bacillota bacterium]
MEKLQHRTGKTVAKSKPSSLKERLKLADFGTGLTFLFALIAWEVVSRVFHIPVYILPPPTLIIGQFFARFGMIWNHARVTIFEVMLGYGTSILIAIPTAVAISRSRFVEKTVYPLLVSSQFVPKTAIAPLFIIWFGFGVMPKVMLTFLMSFFPLLVDSVIGFKSLRPEMEYLAKSMGASPLQIFRRIQFPNALPNIFGGLKVSGAFATSGAVVAEFVGSDSGLGYLLLRANGDFDTELLFAILFFLTAFGYALYALVELVERATIPWHVSKRGEAAGQ